MRFRDFKLKGSARTGVEFKYPSRQSKSRSRNFLSVEVEYLLMCSEEHATYSFLYLLSSTVLFTVFLNKALYMAERNQQLGAASCLHLQGRIVSCLG
jgi:hypothetical protein